MSDVERVAAYWLDCKTLQVECPYCRRIHYHCAARSPYNDIREANCQRKHLPKKLRGQKLVYRLYRVRGPCEEAGRVIPFPKRHATEL